MHARALHLGQFGDGARQFALQCALIVDALHEIGLPDLVLVKKFKSDALPMQSALARQFDACFVNLIRRHEDGGSRVGNFVGDFFLFQEFDHAGRIFLIQLAIQDLVVDLVHPEDHAEECDQERGQQSTEENALGQ